MHHTHCTVGEKTFIAPINPGAPARICYGESERKQKRRAQKIGKSRRFDLRSLHRREAKSINCAALGGAADQRERRSAGNGKTWQIITIIFFLTLLSIVALTIYSVLGFTWRNRELIAPDQSAGNGNAAWTRRAGGLAHSARAGGGEIGADAFAVGR
jgi:hypothetical protein